MDYAIEIQDLEKRYNGFLALDKVSFRVDGGDVVGYLGPNGAGKTTTIKILTNLLKPTSGHAYICGIDVNDRPKEALQHVGSLIEVPGIYDYLSPHELLSHLGKIRRMPRSDIDTRIKEVLKLTKITEWEHRKIGAFSTGMLRRLMISTAILHDPEILILDEPVIGLDPKGIREVRELIRQFQEEEMTVFLSSHLLQEVSETCNTVIFIDKGKIVAHDTVENLTTRTGSKVIRVNFLKPLSNQEASLIGSMPDVGSIQVQNGSATISFDGERETASNILSNLIGEGFRIVNYGFEEASLEDFYVSIMDNEKGVDQ
jgi:ABC-2 type transport system ATP-binding protein